MTKTIIYYSSGREKGDFEERVQDNILRISGDLDIISVSQYPLEFGYNICVGDVGVSGFNMYRQVQIACEAATGDFIISTEADCLYPPDYFRFTPDRLDIPYRDTNLYVMPDARDYFFYKKEGASHAQIVGREFYLKRLNELFTGAPKWSTEEKNFPRERGLGVDVFKEFAYFRSDNPVVQIKTHKGMRYHTHSDRNPITELPYWGEGTKVRALYLHGKAV